MILYFSGATKDVREVMGERATVMTTFWDSRNKPCKLHREMSDGEHGIYASHFLDSGSFSLRTKAAKWGKANGKGEFDWYGTPEFEEYLDKYAEFVSNGAHFIDHYPNLDVIPNRDLSYEHQVKLEERGLEPVPVIHYSEDVNEDVECLRWYLDSGYEFIAFGGLAGSLISPESCHRWIGRMFEEVCDPETLLPTVKIHGFGVTSFEFLRRYPWWSVDSTSWAKRAGYGMIFIPWYRDGKWDFDRTPLCPFVAADSPYRGGIEDENLDTDLLELGIRQTNKPTQHVMDWRGRKRELVDMWLDEIGETFEGVSQHGKRRVLANIKYFDRFTLSRPEWPWKFRNPNPIEDSFGL